MKNFYKFILNAGIKFFLILVLIFILFFIFSFFKIDKINLNFKNNFQNSKIEILRYKSVFVPERGEFIKVPINESIGEKTIIGEVVDSINNTENNLKNNVLDYFYQDKNQEDIIDQNGELNYYSGKIENSKSFREKIYQTFFK